MDLKNLVEAKTLWKTQQMFLILEDSDAVFHEDSEYHLGCIIWTS